MILSGFSQNVTIPDANFKAFLVNNASINTNLDAEIQETEANSFSTQINCSSENIADLTGIEAFTSLQILKCNSNQLTSLDLSQNVALTTLECNSNQIASINLTQNTQLTSLKCNVNSIPDLDLSQNTLLSILQCNLNTFSTLDLSNNPELSQVLCSFQPNLTDINVSQNPNLTLLNCFQNQLTSLDLSNCSSLTQLNCTDNQLTSLNVANGNNLNMLGSNFNVDTNPDLNCIQVDDATYSDANWTNIDGGVSFSTTPCPCNIYVSIPDVNFKAYLVGNPAINTNLDGEIQCSEAASFNGTIDCSNLNINDLTGIEAFTSLNQLFCNTNNIAELDLTQNTFLTKLNINSNSVNSLDLSQNTILGELRCEDNLLSSLNLAQNTQLTYLSCTENTISNLDLTQNTLLINIKCQQNELSSLDLSNQTVLQFLTAQTNDLTSINLGTSTNLVTVFLAENNLTSIDLSSSTGITDLRLQFNELISLDCTNNVNLETIFANDNYLENLNVANGANATLTTFHSTNNPNLTCIQVDDSTYSADNWTNIDAQSFFSDVPCNILVNSITVQGEGGMNEISVNGGTLQMEAILLPANPNDDTYTWSITNETGTATIDINGLVTAISNGTVTVTATANDASGVSGSASVTISNQNVGINENHMNANISIFPNPTNGVFNIKSDNVISNHEIIVINEIGQTVYRIRLDQQLTQVNLSQLEKGIYILQDSEFNFTEKLIIK